MLHRAAESQANRVCLEGSTGSALQRHNILNMSLSLMRVAQLTAEGRALALATGKRELLQWAGTHC